LEDRHASPALHGVLPLQHGSPDAPHAKHVDGDWHTAPVLQVGPAGVKQHSCVGAPHALHVPASQLLPLSHVGAPPGEAQHASPVAPQ
jgi:hypothetical protein